MSYLVHILDTTTGERRVYTDSGEWWATSDYMWTEGNYGCDCNRSLFFARAAQLPDPESSGFCSREKRYTVERVELPGLCSVGVDDVCEVREFTGLVGWFACTLHAKHEGAHEAWTFPAYGSSDAPRMVATW